MSVLEDVADRMAQQALDVLEAQEDPSDDKVIRAVADAIGNASPTLQEAFLTQVRIRRAERRGLAVLEAASARLAKAQADRAIGLPAPKG